MSDNLAAFTLKEAVKDDFAGGSFAFRDGETFNLKEALDANDGVIVVADPQLREALTASEVLKSASVPENPTVSGPYDGEQPPAAAAPTGTDSTDASAGPELVDSEKLDREDLDAIAADELDDYDPADFRTKADVADAINDARKEA